MNRKTPTTNRISRLIAGVSVLFILGYGTVVGTAPTVIAPITLWTPYRMPQEARYATPTIIPVSSPIPSPSRTLRPSTRPTVRPKIVTTRSLKGEATWYCAAGISRCTHGYPDRTCKGCFDAYGAAGPRLRAALGNWRGRSVRVNGVPVKLIDFCLCTGGPNRLIDLYFDVWKITGSHITIRW